MNPTNCLGWAVTIAFLIALALRAARGSTKGGVRPFWKRAWAWWLDHPWPWLLAHPLGGLVYVLITVLGPALLGVPNLVPKNLIWLMLGLIGLASVYGVKKTGRDAKLRDGDLVERLRGIIKSERRENENLVEFCKGIIESKRRENENLVEFCKGIIESKRRENEAERRENEAARRRVEALREEE